jgi:RecA/RadA recombinase
MKKSATILLIAAVALLAACGGQDKPAADQPAAAKPQAPSAQAAAPAAEDEGVQMAKEILAVYDEAAAEAAGLAKSKPEAAVLKPQLEALLEKYAARMAALNPRFQDLRDKDVRLFGSANGYLGEHRGRHYAENESRLKDIYVYYNLEKGEREIVDLLSNKIVRLIDIAVKM